MKKNKLEVIKKQRQNEVSKIDKHLETIRREEEKISKSNHVVFVRWAHIRKGMKQLSILRMRENDIKEKR